MDLKCCVQDAYTTAYGQVMSTYTEPQMAVSQLSSLPCVYPDSRLTNGMMTTYADEGIQDVAYFQGTEIYAEPYQSDSGIVAMSACEHLPSSYDNMVSNYKVCIPMSKSSSTRHYLCTMNAINSKLRSCQIKFTIIQCNQYTVDR
jgi:hypothetical protein